MAKISIAMTMVSFLLCGCSTVATQKKLVNGELVIVEELTIKGIKSDNKAKFSDKSEIESKSGLSDMFPDIEIDADKILD